MVTANFRYDPGTDSWERVCPLPGPSTQHAAATLDNYLYVSGGLDRDIVLNSVKRCFFCVLFDNIFKMI